MRYSQGYGSMGGGTMGGSLLDEFKNAFSKPDNGLIQIILINLAVFVALIILRVLLTFSGAVDVYHKILSWLMLPASIPEFIVKPLSLPIFFCMKDLCISCLTSCSYIGLVESSRNSWVEVR
jgi:hypothetical protein